MDIDDDATSSFLSSAGRTPSHFHPGDHQLTGSIRTPSQSLATPDYERLPDSDDSPQLMVLASSSSHLEELGGIRRPGDHGPQRQHRDILSSLNPFVQGITPRKRKRTDGMTDTHMTDNNNTPHDDASIDDPNPRFRRRTRPRLRVQQDGKFSPLLIMSPFQERDSPEERETLSVFHYPPPSTDMSDSIRQYFHLENPLEHAPRMLQSNSLPRVDSLEEPKEPGRADSASSFAEVALATTAARRPGRLSTLQDFHLPRPFEETERPSSSSINLKVHARGLDALPAFLSTSGGRMDGLGASRAEPAGSPTDPLGHSIRLPTREHDARGSSTWSGSDELPSMTVFFDKPICDSPDPIDVEQDPASAMLGARFEAAPQGQSLCRTTGDSDGSLDHIIYSTN